MDTVLITGAEGRIGTILRQALADLPLRLLSRAPVDGASHVADIADLDAISPAFAGVDTVVHLAAEASPSAEWPAVLRSNIVGTRNVFEAARLAGVRRVVFASSTHAVAGHEQAAGPALYDVDDPRRFGVDVAPWPDSAYGVSKLFGEALGRWYSDAHGVSVICLRIGWVWDRPDDELVRRRWPDDEPGLTDEVRAARRRSRAIWLSHRDCARVFRAAIEAPAGLRYAVVYATSGNPRQIWDLEPARRLLGFEPLDGAPGVIA